MKAEGLTYLFVNGNVSPKKFRPKIFISKIHNVYASEIPHTSNPLVYSNFNLTVRASLHTGV
jgi:hypothetical protein